MEYFECARCLLLGVQTPAEALIHAPLYPYFLAFLMRLCGDSIFALRLSQSLLCMLGVIPFYLALRRSFPAENSPFRHVPAVFAVLYVLWPPLVVYESDFFAETLMMILFGASIAFLTRAVSLGDGRRKRIFLAASGVFAGLGAVTHPVMLFWGAGAAVYLYCCETTEPRFDRKRILRPILFALFVGLTILPVCVSNYLRTKEFVPIQENGAFNIWLGNSAEATGGCRIPPGDEWERMQALPQKEGVSSGTWFTRKLFSDLCARPVRVLGNLPKKALLAISPYELTTWSDTAVLRRTVFHAYFFHGWFVCLTLCGGAGLILFLKHRSFRRRGGLFLVSGAAFWAGAILLVASGRYRLPLYPCLMFSSAYFLCALPFLCRAKKFSAILSALAISVLCVLAAAWLSPRDFALETTVARSYLAEAYQRAGDHKAAKANLLPADPERGTTRTWNLLGNLYFDEGNLKEAERCYELACKRSGRSAESLSNLGRVRMERKDYPGAAMCFREAFSKTSGRAAAPVLYNFGELFRRAGNPKESEASFGAAVEADPLFDRAWNNLGVLALNRNDFERAEMCFRKALSIAPKMTDRVVNLAYVLFASGRKEAALRELDAALRAPNPPDRAQELRNFILTGK